MLSTIFLSLSLSIKTGAILMIPSFLGTLHLQKGTLNLIISVFVLIFVQLVLASPFLFDPVAKAFGWKLGANTSFIEYLYFTKIITKPGVSGMAAHYDLSYFWKFISKDIYQSSEFCIFLKSGMLFINIYYFFIRR